VRKGAGSVYLGYRVQVGQQVPVFTIANPNFRLPDDDAAPVIMIGPGTGIAPFRAFLQERAARGASGPNWLLFGNPRRGSDYLYEAELEAWRQNGVLSRLDLAFSRDQAEKRYVQHCLQDQAADVYRWLENGASLYVCGDARHMAEDVQTTLLDLIAQQGGMVARERGEQQHSRIGLALLERGWHQSLELDQSAKGLAQLDALDHRDFMAVDLGGVQTPGGLFIFLAQSMHQFEAGRQSGRER
jgi:sulfite reductase alpha subunit-like flavoprotein